MPAFDPQIRATVMQALQRAAADGASISPKVIDAIASSYELQRPEVMAIARAEGLAGELVAAGDYQARRIRSEGKLTLPHELADSLSAKGDPKNRSRKRGEGFLSWLSDRLKGDEPAKPTDVPAAGIELQPKPAVDPQAFLDQYAIAYHDPEHPLFERVPAISFSRAGRPDSPDPKVFRIGQGGNVWFNDNPDDRYYVYSSAAKAYCRKVEHRPDEVFHQQIAPQLAAISDRFDPAIEQRIEILEGKIRDQIATHGMRSIPAFALRGLSVAAGDGENSLDAWAERGHISSGGGNFFVFHPISVTTFGPGGASASVVPKTANELLQKLMASCGSAVSYGTRAQWPVVMVIDLDNDFDIPASGGNDGINGDYPLSIELAGETHHLTNLDVGAITRPGTAGRRIGRIGDGVPPERIRRLVGKNGLPGWAESPRDPAGWSAEQRLAIFRWAYAQVLDALVERL